MYISTEVDVYVDISEFSDDDIIEEYKSRFGEVEDEEASAHTKRIGLELYAAYLRNDTAQITELSKRLTEAVTDRIVA